MFRERCYVPYTAGRQVRGGCDERQPATAAARHFRKSVSGSGQWVLVNGKQVYADRNFFESEEARKYPDARFSLENGSYTLPLEAGDNEVAVAIVNNFFG